MLRQSITKRQRRLGIHVFPKADKYMSRRPYAPGAHGSSRTKRSLSEYGLQLREKQRAKFIYGLTERQFARLYQLANRFKQNVGDALLVLLERRLDNTIFRAGFSITRPQARQWINHGFVLMNDVKVKRPSYLVKPGDQIIVKIPPARIPAKGEKIPTWIKADHKKKSITLAKLPDRSEITTELETQLLVEYYAR